MQYSPESLDAFLQAVETGSFSAAARKLKKSQSTISTAIANLEADLGIALFDRQSRQPVLTPQGQRVLPYVQSIIAASERLDEVSVRLAGNIEPRLSFVLSDLWQTSHHESILKRFSERFPDIEFECLIAEDEDVIDLIQTGRAHVGVLRVQERYPVDVTVARLQVGAQMAIYIHKQHELASLQWVEMEKLHTFRQLCLKTYKDPTRNMGGGPVWSSPSLLMLLEMAEQGFGWGILPRWLVEQFGHGVLQELPVAGWPQHIDVDVMWSNKEPPGAAGRWIIDRLREQQA
ncbi:LysR family transcriptional regulator [Enterobacteriaceae bacterium H20N1]|uniref:LysR family transcriptional regulator n=1 Tax=Dryocola boscaweniae TaxID=2925397 RepID=A0A9X2WA84_9ENTR|nr:LysR family transcriptional regulator [Dryocola boscaweniae]MCT4703916.1 LysR family transcriptional regulator [Dryocola boscaweniae]MCT4717096.1 LysR family transcriptional regulator [Dryocola boscaweniae]MCT4721084.1 LysR family transcriptional regulator [Dryocola boscaweniae]